MLQLQLMRLVVKKILSTKLNNYLLHAEADYQTSGSCEKGHRRIEEREGCLTTKLNCFVSKESWRDLKTLL